MSLVAAPIDHIGPAGAADAALGLPATFGAGEVFFLCNHRSRCAYRWLPAGHRSAVTGYPLVLRSIATLLGHESLVVTGLFDVAVLAEL